LPVPEKKKVKLQTSRQTFAGQWEEKIAVPKVKK
jgi:hypothetical protein